jgi:acyl-CoA synthetase (AMP-forming)/AMP-acid ligase II
VTRRKFDPEATLELIDRHPATGLCVVSVMFDRIMELPDEVRNKYSGRSLRFAAASGSRMRPDVVIKFMDQFGDLTFAVTRRLPRRPVRSRGICGDRAELRQRP